MEKIDTALHADAVAVQVTLIEQALMQAIADPAIRLPACVLQPVEDHYARRELYRSQRHGYSVIAMTWGAGQGTPLHDHDGLWCVEGVWQGALEITPYRHLGSEGDSCRFEPLPSLHAQRGSAGNLIPPEEFHILRNASETAIAVSVHVYQRPMERCTVFEPDAARPGWYRRDERIMATDGAPALAS